MRYQLSKLEKQSGTLQTLVYLSEKGETNFQTAMDEIGMFYSVFYRALVKLKEAGLVTQRVDSTAVPNRNMISLTAKGKKVAELLKKIEEVLKG